MVALEREERRERKEDRDDEKQMGREEEERRGENDIWGSCGSHHFFLCETDMWVPWVLLFFRIEFPRKRYVSATSDEDRVKLAT